jgi:hypothetical protein
MWVRFGGNDRVKPQEYSEYFEDFAAEEQPEMACRWDARTGVILSRALRPKKSVAPRMPCLIRHKFD